ncbi:hypothetical protein XELAEV_18022684mg [Xenopus laevis]|uniref:Uncharacterized protein n=1 Tax=Xenopus laevis TaxID=8355 RepID=A0A974D574_XENLA|nr:hypothetical protein XELAEV_18022684mg [Xenopus laevis]
MVHGKDHLPPHQTSGEQTCRQVSKMPLLEERHLLAVPWSTRCTSKLFSWQWTDEVASLLVLGLFSSSGTMRTVRQDPGVEPWWETSRG